MTIKAYCKSIKTTVKRIQPKNTKASKHFPDLTEFRKSIHYKGKSLTEILIKGRHS